MMKLVSNFLISAVMLLLLLAATGAAAAQEKPKQGDDAPKSGSTADAWRRALPEREETASPADGARAAALGAEGTPQMIERQLRDFEQNWANALNSGDADQLKRLLAADFTLAGARAPQLVVGKKQYVADASRDAKPDYLSLGDLQVHVYSDAAVVSGRYKQRAAAAGEEGGDLIFTDVWIRGATGWKAVSRHLSRVPASGDKVN